MNNAIEKEVQEAVSYIWRVTKQQGFLMDCKTLFGDGSKYKHIGFSGFQIVYNEFKKKLDNTTL